MIKFYDVKLRAEVMIDPLKVEGVTYERETKSGKTQIRYAMRAKTEDGRNLTKFVGKDAYDAHMKMLAEHAKKSK